MPDYIRADVTSEDIEKGQRWNVYGCPMAVALNRQYPDQAPWCAGVYEAFPNGYGARGEMYPYSRRAIAWIRDYDRTGTAEPAKFRLRVEGREDK